MNWYRWHFYFGACWGALAATAVFMAAHIVGVIG